MRAWISLVVNASPLIFRIAFVGFSMQAVYTLSLRLLWRCFKVRNLSQSWHKFCCQPLPRLHNFLVLADWACMPCLNFSNRLIVQYDIPEVSKRWSYQVICKVGIHVVILFQRLFV